MAFRFLNPEFREAHRPIDPGYRPLPWGGLVRTAILLVVAVGGIYVVAHALQSRAELEGQAIIASHPVSQPTDDLTQTATVHATPPSVADSTYSRP